MKKIVLFTIPTLDSLGAQRVLLTLLKNLDFGDDYDIKLLVIKKTGDFVDEIPPHIDVISSEKYILNIPKLRVIELLIYGFYRAIKNIQPTIVVSIVPFTNYATFLPKLIFKLKYKLIISEHAHVTGAIADKENMNNLFQKVYMYTFKKVYNSKLINKIIVIAEESQKDLVENHGVAKEKTFLINNPLDILTIQELAKEETKEQWFNNLIKENRFIIVNSGRLVHQKRQDLLIRSFFKIYQQDQNLRLVILGGGDAGKLKDLINELKINHAVFLAGFQKNPWSFIARSDLFVLSSCWEGLPCVIAETMALNIPIVSTSCPSGPTEMLNNGQLGYLSKNENLKSLTETIQRAIENPKLTREKSELALREVIKYEPKKIAEKYKYIIMDTILNP